MRYSILATAFLLATGLSAQSDNLASITTQGVAHVYALPDEVLVDVTLRNESDDMAEASTATDAQVKAVLQLCLEYGIRPEHAQSRYRRYGKNWRHKQGQPKFEASQTINICLKDLSRYDAFMKAIIDVEVYSISGATFRTTKHREHMDAARRKAIKAAKEKAKLLSSELGQEIGKALTIRETAANQPWRTTSAYANISTETGDAGSSTDGSAFAPGQLKIQAEVEVSFVLN